MQDFSTGVLYQIFKNYLHCSLPGCTRLNGMVYLSNALGRCYECGKISPREYQAVVRHNNFRPALCDKEHLQLDDGLRSCSGDHLYL